MSCSIGEFYMVNYHPMLKNSAYHRILLFLLRKHECKKLRRNDFKMAIMMLLHNLIMLNH